MVKAQDMQSILGPVKRAFPGWAYHRGWFFQLPIDFYLRGMAFKQSWSNKHVVEVLHCVYPLFESQVIHIIDRKGKEGYTYESEPVLVKQTFEAEKIIERFKEFDFRIINSKGNEVD